MPAAAEEKDRSEVDRNRLNPSTSEIQVELCKAETQTQA